MLTKVENRHRRSIRIPGYDYSQTGAYFVTICVEGKRNLLGEIQVLETGAITLLNDAGKMIQHWWQELNRKFDLVKTDESVVMPNHFHGIIMITNPNPVGADLRVCPDPGAHTGAPLPTIIQWFKTMTTNAYIRGVKEESWPSFKKRLWQRNYYEHIIRDEKSLNRIREYILFNPSGWNLDRENPLRQGEDPFDQWLASHQGPPGGVELGKRSQR